MAACSLAPLRGAGSKVIDGRVKVLFHTVLPHPLAHGGAQIVADSVMRELRALGVDVEPLRWWEDQQPGDVLHCVGRPSNLFLRLAKEKGFKFVMTEFLDQTASRTPRQLWLQRWMIRGVGRLLGKGFLDRMGWDVYREADALIFSVPHEWEVAKYLFGATPDRGHIIGHGVEVESVAALAREQKEEDYLISIATIAPRKNSVLLAEAAHETKTPVVFLGKPYAATDAYFRRFLELVDGRMVRYPGFVSTEEKFRLLRGARGFVLLSQQESGCIAVYEAGAAGLPLLLSNLPWANKVYHGARKVHFVEIGSRRSVAIALEEFGRTAHRESGTTFPISTWREVAERYRATYEQILMPTP